MSSNYHHPLVDRHGKFQKKIETRGVNSQDTPDLQLRSVLDNLKKIASQEGLPLPDSLEFNITEPEEPPPDLKEVLIRFELSNKLSDSPDTLPIKDLKQKTRVTIACKRDGPEKEFKPEHFQSLAIISSIVVSHALANYRNVHLLMACPQSIVLALGYLLQKATGQECIDQLPLA